MVRAEKRKSGSYGSQYLDSLQNSLKKLVKVNESLESEQDPKEEILKFQQTFNSRFQKDSVERPNFKSFEDRQIIDKYKKTNKISNTSYAMSFQDNITNEDYQKQRHIMKYDAKTGKILKQNNKTPKRTNKMKQILSKRTNYEVHNPQHILSSTFT